MKKKKNNKSVWYENEFKVIKCWRFEHKPFRKPPRSNFLTLTNLPSGRMFDFYVNNTPTKILTIRIIPVTSYFIRFLKLELASCFILVLD